MSRSDMGLVVFVVVVALNVAGLLVDWALDRNGFTTITERVWLAPLLGVPILALQLLGFVGLAVHFYYRG